MPSEPNLILLGPPGSGKGTQAARLRVDLSVPLISTGEILRANAREQTKLGVAAAAHMNAGRLVPDELVIAMTIERLNHSDAHAGFILDGFPRTAAQADALARRLDEQGRRVTTAVLLDVPDTQIMERIAGRRVCIAADHNYHVEHHRPKRPGLCDHDASPLVQRDDDKPHVVKSRLRVYHEQTGPLVNYYLERGLLRTVDGTASPGDVSDRIRAIVRSPR
jgi:adenylate kinase